MDQKTQGRRDSTITNGDSAPPDNRQLTTDNFSSFAARITQLTRSIETLAQSARRVGARPPQGREWFDLLQRKLLPQLQGPPLLIVAIVGGTNIGKSVIFNLLAGEVASASSPLAAGTKHPVCLVPPGCDDPELLGRLFEHFELRAWQSADDPLDDAPADRIYWRMGPQV
ncbi:MAG: GTPase, partial [Thermoguttaceae bacterium]